MAASDSRAKKCTPGLFDFMDSGSGPMARKTPTEQRQSIFQDFCVRISDPVRVFCVPPTKNAHFSASFRPNFCAPHTE